MKKYRILLFDLDGVIFDFDKTEQYAFKEGFLKIGIEVEERLWSLYQSINQQLWKDFELKKVSKEEVTIGRFKILFDTLTIKADATQFAHDYQNLLAKGYFLIEDAKNVLSTLTKDYRLFAVTNGVSSTAFSRLRGTDTLKYFEEVFVSEDLKAQKPSFEYFSQVFNRIVHFEKESTLLIGDSLTSDILGANIAGIDSCWLNMKSLKNDTKAIPTYEMNEISKIFEILS